MATVGVKGLMYPRSRTSRSRLSLGVLSVLNAVGLMFITESSHFKTATLLKLDLNYSWCHMAHTCTESDS